MPATSEARVIANRQNALKSTGPKTVEGKAQSRRNGLKHGLTGSGVVVAEPDVSEVERRTSALMGELDPKSSLGKIMVGQLATLSVRMERSAKQEEAALANRVRHAAEVFDQDRLDRAEELFGTIGEAPRDRLRQLRRSPEGVERLILAWSELRDDLTREPQASATESQLERFANLVGLRLVDDRASWLKALTLDRLAERIDDEIAELEAHYETFDFEVIAQDRAGAAAIALFDPSREAALARRYEAEARRGFFKALKELRQAEAEAADRPDSAPIPEPLGSSCAERSPTPREPKPAVDERLNGTFGDHEGMARGLDGRVVAVGRAVGASR